MQFTLSDIPGRSREIPLARASNETRVGINADMQTFNQLNRYISEIIEDRLIDTMEY